MTELGLVVMRHDEFLSIEECQDFIEANCEMFTWDGVFGACDYYYRCWDEGCQGKALSGRYVDVKEIDNKWNGYDCREHIYESGPTLFQGKYALVTRCADDCRYVEPKDIDDEDWIIVISAHT